MRIVQLEAENVKRLKAVRIAPDGSMVVIGGRNGQGKTSVLDSIAMLLGGKNQVPLEPVRHGEKKGNIVGVLGERNDAGEVVPKFIVQRRFSKSGSELVVKSPEGSRYESPQRMLDKLVGELSFDPLAFARQSTKEQSTTLRELVGLDFSELDAKRKALYDNRTDRGRELKRLQGARESMQTFPDAKSTPVSELTEQLKKLQAQNADRASEESNLHEMQNSARHLKRQVEDLEAQLAKAKADLEAVMEEGKKQRAKVEAMPQHDVAPLLEQIEKAEVVNRQAAANEKAKELDGTIETLEEEVAKLTSSIKNIDEEKARQIAEAKYPVPGLSVDDERGVLLDGVPLSQASGAELIRVSAAIGIALNPTLRVLLIRDGSLLDDDSLKLLAEVAEQHDCQVWLERVGKGAECSVIIEDGEVQAQAAEAEVA